MKKSVIIVILIIYVFAIVIVGFLGLKMKVYDPIVYVDEIICVSDNYRHNEDPNIGYDGYIRVSYSAGVKVLIKCQVKPDNADNKNFRYVYDEGSTKYNVEINNDGTATVEFLKPGVANITVEATDSKGKQLIIKVMAIGDM